MPYESREELPDPVKENLPKHAQHIYREAYSSAWDQYGDPEKRGGDGSREAAAHKVAWSAVKDKYEKKNGTWEPKAD